MLHNAWLLNKETPILMSVGEWFVAVVTYFWKNEVCGVHGGERSREN